MPSFLTISGLAVSGGADSLALASLCSPLNERYEFKPFIKRAFVVDHRTRRGSSEEAHYIVNLLETKLGT